MSKTSQAADLNQLFGAAADSGDIPQSVFDGINVEDLGADIQAGFGTGALEVKSSEVTLVGILIDDSGSIESAGKTQDVIDGHNLVIEALRGAGASRDGILVSTRFLSGQVLFPFVPVDQAILLDSSTYEPIHGTPLYDQMAVLGSTMIGKCQDFLDNGIDARTLTLYTTDGADLHSRKQNADTVRALHVSMENAERHLVYGFGIGDMSFAKGVFESVGIKEKRMLAGKTPTEIRAAFRTFSQSAVTASRGAAGFSAASGGFGG